MPRVRREIPWLDLRGGIYCIFWYNLEKCRTERLSLRTRNPEEARRLFGEFLLTDRVSPKGTRRAALAIKPERRALKVTQALDDYLREHAFPKTADPTRQKIATRHLAEYFKKMLLKDVDIPASRGYADARRRGLVGTGRGHRTADAPRKAKAGSDATIRRELNVLIAAANHARKWKRIAANEMPSIEVPSEPRKEAPYLTEDELRLARRDATPELRAFIDIAYHTGGRRKSIERLKKSQVDMARWRIDLQSPDATPVQRLSTKRRPIVPIDPEIRPTVERLMRESPETEWLFGVPRDMYRRFNQHMKSIGLGHKANPHILRHSRATHLLQRGVDPYAVAGLIGDSLATVIRVYGHHCPDYLAKTLGKSPLSEMDEEKQESETFSLTEN